MEARVEAAEKRKEEKKKEDAEKQRSAGELKGDGVPIAAPRSFVASH